MGGFAKINRHDDPNRDKHPRQLPFVGAALQPAPCQSSQATAISSRPSPRSHCNDDPCQHRLGHHRRCRASSLAILCAPAIGTAVTNWPQRRPGQGIHQAGAQPGTSKFNGVSVYKTYLKYGVPIPRSSRLPSSTPPAARSAAARPAASAPPPSTRSMTPTSRLSRSAPCRRP